MDVKMECNPFKFHNHFRGIFLKRDESFINEIVYT